MHNTLPDLVFRNYQTTDYAALKAAMQATYPNIENAYLPQADMDLLSALYPEGQIVCTLDNVLIGAILTRIVPRYKYVENSTEADILNVNYFIDDTREGDSIFTLDYIVLPEYRRLKIGQKLQQHFQRVVFRDNFYHIIGASRLVNYHKYQKDMSIETYVEKVKSAEIIDPTLGFHLSNKLIPGAILYNFCPEDVECCGHALCATVANPDFMPEMAVYPQRWQHLAKLRLKREGNVMKI